MVIDVKAAISAWETQTKIHTMLLGLVDTWIEFIINSSCQSLSYKYKV
jgi:hypothetical protein